MSTFNERLLQTMEFERKNRIRSGVYGFTQREMAYNSNKIEGSRLTKEHTSSLFDNGSIYFDGEYRAKDIEEATGHFIMFNTMLDTINCSLSENMIKAFHKALKEGVFEDRANGYAIGDYKKRRNAVSNIDTVEPSDVEAYMQKLLQKYSTMSKNITTLDWFHAKYEHIHPFQDGNGRIGRVIMFRECIVNGITPFIVRDVNKARYTDALNRAQLNGDYSRLTQYFNDEQEWYKSKVSDMLY